MGREAYEQRAWADAFRFLSSADRASPLAPDDLERMALSAGLVGHDEEHLKTMERVFQVRLDAGESLRAARTAFWLGFRMMSLGRMGQGAAWLARSRELVAQSGVDCVEQGYLLLPETFGHLASGDLVAACDTASRAAETGDRFHERDLSAFARVLHGMARLRQGRVADGIALLDQAMLVATSETLSPVVTGLIYCNVIDGCQRVYALDRAREWTAAIANWCEAQPQLVMFSSACRAKRAEILQLQGDWTRAIEEAERAAASFAGLAHPEGAGPVYYQQAEIHRLRGELAAAESAYRLCSRHGHEPQPGLALLRMAQGDPRAAAGAIRRVLDATRDPMWRTRYLPAFVEIMISAGELEEARRGARELQTIARQSEIDVLATIAAQAAGSVELAAGDARAALTALRTACDGWRRVGAPYLAARIRVQIGLACRALGDEEGAALEWDAAREVFAALGAAPDLAQLDASARGARPAASHGLTRRELEVLRLVAAGKTNKAIASELFLSEKTIDRHVANIFNKIDVSSRAAATAYAYEHGLIEKPGARG